MSWIKGQGLGDLVYQDHDVLPENALLKVAQLFVGIDVVQVAPVSYTHLTLPTTPYV